MIEAALNLGGKLIVVVNNDVQQVQKKGKIILNQENRARLMAALRGVDEVIMSIDQDPTQIETLRFIADKYPDDEIVFANGGDRDSEKAIPETAICVEKNIKMVFGMGIGKPDSSTRINQALGHAR